MSARRVLQAVAGEEKRAHVLVGRSDATRPLLLVSPADDSGRFRLSARHGRLWSTNLGLLSLATYLERSGWTFQAARVVEDMDALATVCRDAWVGISVLPSNYGLIRDKKGFYKFPDPKFVVGSNFCDVGFDIDEDNNRVVVLSASDNLMKGAAGSAIQNMNVMAGFNEMDGISQTPLTPV